MDDSRSRSAGDRRPFVVLGDGLSAGMGHFSLEGSFQETSFPALAARALGFELEQRLFEPPGLGDVIGLPSQPTLVPGIRQSTVLRALPATPSRGNLSVPGFGLEDAIRRRPRAPLVDRASSVQTVANFVLGLPDLEWDPDGGRCMLELARDAEPELVLICFGFDEALRAAVAGRPEDLPSEGRFERYLERLLSGWPAGTGRVVCTVPDPFDGAYFAGLGSAAEILKTTPDFVRSRWGVADSDCVPLPSLYAMGHQLMGRAPGPLPPNPTGGPEILRAGRVGELRDAIGRLGDAVLRAGARTGAHVFDLRATLSRVAVGGSEGGLEVDLKTGPKRLTSTYLGGLYLLNGAYPGATLNAAIAEALAQSLEASWGVRGEPVPVADVAAADANTLCELAPGSTSTDAFLRPRTESEQPTIPAPPPGIQPFPIQTTYPQLQPGKQGCVPAVGIPAAGLSEPSYQNPGFRPLQVPLDGLDYTLEINRDLSCFGDALRVVDCPGEPPLLPGFPPFGLCERTFFGGFLLTTSALSGKIHVKISPPDEQGRARFEIRHPGGLRGVDGDLAGPQLFRMPVQHTRVRDLPGFVSSGVLDTRTGSVFDFHYNLQNTNTALASLLALNPQLPPPVQSTVLTFPGAPNGGSSWVEFTPRDDGLFDVSIDAHMFVPLGTGSDDQPLRFALPFTTPDLKAASFVARGTSLHPRISVTTRSTPAPAKEIADGDIPFDSVVELTSTTYATFFGDAFDLHATELGDGGATGRSHLLSRVRAQFGTRSGDAVAVALQILPPGGLLGRSPAPPPFLPPGVSRGGAGFDTVLYFPTQSYPQNGLNSPDDAFNVATTTIHLPSGQPVTPLLWRGFVVQALFADLIQVEPCTPADSFNYQGPARFDFGAEGISLHWNGTVFLPYPKGFRFPSANPGGRPALVIEGDSRLDPFRSVRASSGEGGERRGSLEGRVDRARSPSTGAEFSYSYSVPRDPARAMEARFEYVNHTQDGTFRLTSLSWLDATARQATFGGFGTWSLEPDTLHQVSVQISTDPKSPYVGIQVDGGLASNVDLRPDQQPKA